MTIAPAEMESVPSAAGDENSNVADIVVAQDVTVDVAQITGVDVILSSSLAPSLSEGIPAIAPTGKRETVVYPGESVNTYETARTHLEQALRNDGVAEDGVASVLAFTDGIKNRTPETITILHDLYTKAEEKTEDNDLPPWLEQWLKDAQKLFNSSEDFIATTLSEITGDDWRNLGTSVAVTAVLGYVGLTIARRWKDSPKTRGIYVTAFVSTLLLACVVAGGVGEFPTAPPTAAGEVQTGVEGAISTIIVTDENGNEYSVNEGRTFTSEPYYGYLINYETNTGTETVNRFQFARADVQNVNDPSKTDFVTLFQQVDKYGNPTAELFLIETDTPGVYELIDQYNNRPGYSIVEVGDRVIFRVKEGDTVSDYLISKKLTPSADGSTPVATQSPEDLRAEISASHKVQTIFFSDNAATLAPTVTAESSPTPASTPTPDTRPPQPSSEAVWSPELQTWLERHTPPGGIMLIDEDLSLWPVQDAEGNSLGNVFPFTLEVDSRLGWKENVVFNPASKPNEYNMRLGTFSSIVVIDFANVNEIPKNSETRYDDILSMLTGYFEQGKTMKISINGKDFYWTPRDGVISRLVQKGTLDSNDPLVHLTDETLWKIEVVNKRLVTTTEVANLNEMSDWDKLESMLNPLGMMFLYKGEMPGIIASFHGQKNAGVFSVQAGGSRTVGSETVFGPFEFVPMSDLNSPSLTPTPTPSPSANSNIVVAGRQ